MLTCLQCCLTRSSVSSLQQFAAPLAYRSLRVSDSVSLSSNTCCRRSASLLSDDAESSPPSTLLVFLSPSLLLCHVHACMFLAVFILSRAQALSSLSGSCSPLQMSPLLSVFHLHLPSFLLICLCDKRACPFKLWVLLCLAFPPATPLVNNRICPVNGSKFSSRMWA